MDNKVLVIGGHGLGDCLMSLQCAVILQRHGINPKVRISAREEVYKPLAHLFSHYFDMEHIDETYAADNMLLKDESALRFVTSDYDEFYYVIPDLLFNNKHAFDCEKYHTSPQMIRGIRLLDGQNTTTKTIFLGLMTTTDGYMYGEPMNLATSLAYNVPDHTIYFPVVTQWASKNIQKIDIPTRLPTNLKVVVNPDFNEAMDVLLQSCYFIGTDNGPSHLAYHAAVPRLLLDPQFNRLPWLVRWREDYLESIPITATVEDVTNLVKTNITVPQTLLAPRMVCLVNGLANWEQLLWLKTE